MDREEIYDFIDEEVGKYCYNEHPHYFNNSAYITKWTDWHIAELENATKELKQKLEDERYIKAEVIETAVIETAKREGYVLGVNNGVEECQSEIENAKREARVEVAREIKTVIGDYSNKSAELAFKKCKEIINNKE